MSLSHICNPSFCCHVKVVSNYQPRYLLLLSKSCLICSPFIFFLCVPLYLCNLLHYVCCLLLLISLLLCQESTWLYLLIAWGCASEGRMREGGGWERLGWRGEILGGI